MLPIQFLPINFNHNKGNNRPKYIVIHDTANPNAGAVNHWKYFGAANRNASAHYFVDNDNIVQIIADSDSAWHCGDGKGKYGITNSNSLSIEICLPGDFSKSVSNTVELTKHLMTKYGITAERVVRHFDASRKLCPRSLSANDWAKWKEFKSKLGEQSFKEQKSSGLFRVQVGAYSKKENAQETVNKLKKAGFDAIIKTD